MSVINPLWIAEARKQWPLVGAVLIFIGFLLVHQLIFAPTVRPGPAMKWTTSGGHPASSRMS